MSEFPGGLRKKNFRVRQASVCAWRSAGLQPVFACRLSFARAPWASGWRAGDAALSAQRRVPDGVRPRVTREVRSGCVAVSLAECLVLWFCVSLLCDRHRPSCVHPYRVGVPVVGRTVFRLPINQSRGNPVHGTNPRRPVFILRPFPCECTHPLAKGQGSLARSPMPIIRLAGCAS